MTIEGTMIEGAFAGIEAQQARRAAEEDHRRQFEAVNAANRARHEERLRTLGWLRDPPDEEQRKAAMAAAVARAPEAAAERERWQAFAASVAAASSTAERDVEEAVRSHDLERAVAAQQRADALRAVAAHVQRLQPRPPRLIGAGLGAA